jgi:hypothetical protein
MSELIENLFLSVGAIKAGTTWLYDQLADHPEIHFSREKEIHYFAHLHLRDKPLGRERRLQRFKQFIGEVREADDIEARRQSAFWFANYLSEPINDLWYLNLFVNRGRHRYLADFSNLYALLPDDGWRHIRDITRTVRVIYTMRHPIHRLWSHTRFHLQFIGKIDRLAAWSIDDYRRFLALRHVDAHTHYGDIVEALRRNLGDGELRVYFFEDFRDRPLDMLRDVEGFLEINPKVFLADRLNRKVNATPEVDIPLEFVELCQPILKREYAHLAALGLQVPSAWLADSTAPEATIDGAALGLSARPIRPDGVERGRTEL